MPTITINIPDAVAPRVLDAMAQRYGWSAETGLTKPQFAKSVLVNLLKDTVRSHEGQIAAVAATRVARDAVDSEIDIT